MAAYTAIDDPELYFQTVIYTGNGSTQSITLPGSEDMAPDYVRIKNRDATDSNLHFDSPRGATLYWEAQDNSSGSNATDADTLTSFDSDGFSLGADVKVNTNTEKYVAWCWKGGTTSGIDTTGVEITPSAYSFNQTSGFSVIKYTGSGTAGDEVAHGLNAIPEFMVVRLAEDGGSGDHPRSYNKWQQATPELNHTGYNYTWGTQDSGSPPSAPWHDEAVTSVHFSIGTDGAVNTTDDVHSGLFWTSKQGFSKLGIYYGNGNADGPFVYCGLRPAFIKIKQMSTDGEHWLMYDNKRDTYNPSDTVLYSDGTATEATIGTSLDIDILSNGFKIRNTDVNTNESGQFYFFMAMAEAPFVNSNGVPCNAR